MIVGLMREVEVAIESKKLQTRGCLNVEESGEVVADEWLHHLRSTREGSRSRISPTKQAIATDHLLFTCIGACCQVSLRSQLKSPLTSHIDKPAPAAALPQTTNHAVLAELRTFQTITEASPPLEQFRHPSLFKATSTWGQD